MPHYLYQTEGFIIGSRSTGEGSRLLDLLTHRLGRVSILAQGTRELRSKLRYHLSELTFFQATLVKGREFWRLVGAEPIADLNIASLVSDVHRRALTARLALLLRRFLVADGKPNDPQLYLELRSAVSFLARNNLSRLELERYEIASVWRLLALLGYGRRTPALEAILAHQDWSPALILSVATCQAEVVASINEALYHSHL
ncbi:MAG: recombination protein O N-terminal domain-containing protein [Candidatus Vogelbacteria bacterium]